MSKKSALARKRAEEEARQRRKARLRTAGIGAAILLVLAAVVGLIVFFAVRDEGPPKHLVIKDLVVGTGEEAALGDNLTVDYTGWLWHGAKFDSSVGKQPLSFVLGEPGIIQGWQQGLLGMKEGGKRKLIIPPDLAYGEGGAYPAIPPSATLVFEVELLAVE